MGQAWGALLQCDCSAAVAIHGSTPPTPPFFPFLLRARACAYVCVCEEEEQIKSMIQTETERHRETPGAQSMSSYS